MKLFTACLICLLSPASLALSTDQNQPVHIEADKLEIDESRHFSVYQGKVTLQQGSLNIKADRITLFFSNDNDLLRLEVSGSPATFNQLNDQQKLVSGSALKMEYIEDSSIMTLQGNARIVSEIDTIESDKIVINMQTDALQAGNPEGKGRVRMLIKPKESKTDE